MKKPVQIFPTKMRTYSHVGYSRERADYYIGRPDGPTSNLFAISEREVEEILTNLPENLLEIVKKNYKLVEFIEFEPVFTPESTNTTDFTNDTIPNSENVIDLINKSVSDTSTTDTIRLDGVVELDPATITLDENLDAEINIDDMNLKQLRDLASQLEIKNYSKYDKEELKLKILEIVDTEGDEG